MENQFNNEKFLLLKTDVLWKDSHLCAQSSWVAQLFLKRDIHYNTFGKEISCNMIQPLTHLFNYLA